MHGCERSTETISCLWYHRPSYQSWQEEQGTISLMAPWRKTMLLHITRSSTSTEKRSESLQWGTLRGNWKHSITVSRMIFCSLFCLARFSLLLLMSVYVYVYVLSPSLFGLAYAMFPLHGMAWLISAHLFFVFFLIGKSSVSSKQSSSVHFVTH